MTTSIYIRIIDELQKTNMLLDLAIKFHNRNQTKTTYEDVGILLNETKVLTCILMVELHKEISDETRRNAMELAKRPIICNENRSSNSYKKHKSSPTPDVNGVSLG